MFPSPRDEQIVGARDLEMNVRVSRLEANSINDT
jgi:hypothetical protein